VKGLRITPTDEIAEVLLVEPVVWPDDRGFFVETYHRDKYAHAGLDAVFVQDNHSRSVARTLRGLHSQQAPHAQGKLVRCVEGAIWDVAVDVRRGSPTFRRWVARELTADNFHQLYIPEGFLHAFCVLSDTAQVEYKCTDVYSKEDELSVRWNDPELGIDWPIGDPVISPKDEQAPLLAEVMDRLPEYGG
jgi:dTDP-4-dehydrorhamnose 3,5-epimerase